MDQARTRQGKDSTEVVHRVVAALEARRAIAFDEGCPDKEYSEIVWYTYSKYAFPSILAFSPVRSATRVKFSDMRQQGRRANWTKETPRLRGA
jgi:hypothetical protein